MNRVVKTVSVEVTVRTGASVCTSVDVVNSVVEGDSVLVNVSEISVELKSSEAIVVYAISVEVVNCTGDSVEKPNEVKKTVVVDGGLVNVKTS